jgi:hypothetical protein
MFMSNETKKMAEEAAAKEVKEKEKAKEAAGSLITVQGQGGKKSRKSKKFKKHKKEKIKKNLEKYKIILCFVHIKHNINITISH